MAQYDEHLKVSSSHSFTLPVTQNASDMAEQTPLHSDTRGNPITGILLALVYTAFAAVCGSLSQLTLAPVYGSIPAAAQHDSIFRWALLLAFLGKDTILQYLPSNPKRYLSVFAFYVPLLQFFFFRDSNRIGVSIGPATTESLTYFPIVVLCGLCISDSLERLPIFKSRPQLQVVVGVTVYFTLSFGEPLVGRFISGLPLYADLPIPSQYLSKVNLQLATAALATPLSPSWMTFLAVPAIYHATQYNIHFMSPHHTSLLNATLLPKQWSIIDRQESITGYVSVLESHEQQYRVLRCDHSLLGGEWLPSQERIADGITNNEPIYAVFAMLEAVRLVEVAGDTKLDSEKNALVIGAGVGTAPKALLAHGIETTIVELDPVVHGFAQKYFGLPKNHTAILQDAVSWIDSGAISAGSMSNYDFIIHDVFTGGAEPLDLFTESFLRNLRALLNPEGVVAINYAGDASTAPAKQVLSTVNRVFEGKCRLFRDHPPEGEDSAFSNMVIFCLNPTSKRASRPLSFRQPVQADYLGSISRQNYLLPRADLEIRFPSHEEMAGEKFQIITKDNVGKFRKEQLESAKKHWKIMREVVPAFVWENW